MTISAPIQPDPIERAMAALPDGFYWVREFNSDPDAWLPGLLKEMRFRIFGKDALRYPIKTMTIPRNASEEQCAELCRKAWQELLEWRDGLNKTRTDPTFGWLVSRFLWDDFSAFRSIKESSRRGYRQSCRIIQATIGKRHMDFVKVNGKDEPRYTGADILRWHHQWGLPVPVMGPDGKPLKDDFGNDVTEPSAPQRQRHTIVMLRILAKHAVLINAPGAKYLFDLLAAMEFPQPKARDVSATRQDVEKLVAQALKDGYRSIAITTLAQFELIERRIHIIGWWEGKPKVWKPGWRWSDIDHQGPNASWVIRYYQTKVGLVLREFDLKTVPALLELLQATPEGERWGPVIVAERQRLKDVRRPWTARQYAVVFRKIAERAGLPDTLWSMDMRASGTTEADGVEGVSDRMLDDAGGWQDPNTKDRYRRQKQRNAGQVVRLRQAAAGSQRERSSGTNGNGTDNPQGGPEKS
jgi:hypothetical protein